MHTKSECGYFMTIKFGKIIVWLLRSGRPYNSDGNVNEKEMERKQNIKKWYTSAGFGLPPSVFLQEIRKDSENFFNDAWSMMNID